MESVVVTAELFEQFIQRLAKVDANLEALRTEIRRGGSWVTVSEAAQMQGVSTKTIHRRVQAGQIRSNGKLVWIGEAEAPKAGRPKKDGRYPL